MFELFKAVIALVLRGLLPYPDLLRRLRVRRSARSLIPQADFPRDDLVAGSDLAQLALLRVLDLQKRTRRAVRERHREAAVLLARSAMDVSIVAIWCLREPRAVDIMREAQLRSARDNLAGLLVMTELFPEEVLDKAVAALGSSKARLPPVRNMTKTIDLATGGGMEAEFYQRIYDPLSAFFVHANAWSLSRHVDARRRRRKSPTMPWARRSPVRVADACVGLVSAAVATEVGKPSKFFMDYTLAHARRVLPPFAVLLAKNSGQTFNLRSLRQGLKNAAEVKRYLGGPGAADTRAEREIRVRSLFGYALSDPDIPNGAILPVVDHFVEVILSAYETQGDEVRPESILGDSPA